MDLISVIPVTTGVYTAVRNKAINLESESNNKIVPYHFSSLKVEELNSDYHLPVQQRIQNKTIINNIGEFEFYKQKFFESKAAKFENGQNYHSSALSRMKMVEEFSQNYSVNFNLRNKCIKPFSCMEYEDKSLQFNNVKRNLIFEKTKIAIGLFGEMFIHHHQNLSRITVADPSAYLVVKDFENSNVVVNKRTGQISQAILPDLLIKLDKMRGGFSDGESGNYTENIGRFSNLIIFSSKVLVGLMAVIVWDLLLELVEYKVMERIDYNEVIDWNPNQARKYAFQRKALSNGCEFGRVISILPLCQICGIAVSDFLDLISKVGDIDSLLESGNYGGIQKFVKGIQKLENQSLETGIGIKELIKNYGDHRFKVDFQAILAQAKGLSLKGGKHNRDYETYLKIFMSNVRYSILRGDLLPDLRAFMDLD